MAIPILSALTGSHAYGTNVPGSDMDYTAVIVREPEYYLGIPRAEKGSVTVTRVDDPSGLSDRTTYEARHFTSLCLKMNANVVPVLWSPQLTAHNALGHALIAPHKAWNTRRELNAWR